MLWFVTPASQFSSTPKKIEGNLRENKNRLRMVSLSLNLMCEIKTDSSDWRWTKSTAPLHPSRYMSIVPPLCYTLLQNVRRNSGIRYINWIHNWAIQNRVGSLIQFKTSNKCTECFRDDITFAFADAFQCYFRGNLEDKKLESYQSDTAESNKILGTISCRTTTRRLLIYTIILKRI